MQLDTQASQLLKELQRIEKHKRVLLILHQQELEKPISWTFIFQKHCQRRSDYL